MTSEPRPPQEQRETQQRQTTEHEETQLPRWARDLRQSLAVNPQFALWGNVRDRFLITTEHGPAFAELLDVIDAVLTESDYRCVLVHDPVAGVSVLSDGAEPDPEATRIATQLLGQDPERCREPLELDELGLLLERVVHHRDERVAIVLDYGSRLVADPEDLTDEERGFYTRAQKLTHTALPVIAGERRPTPLYNPVLWITDEERDLPSWFAGRDSPVRMLPVAEPHLSQRRAAARQLLSYLDDVGPEPDAAVESFAASSHGLRIGDMVEVLRLARDAGLPPTRLEDAVRAFKVGVLDDPWTRPDLRQQVSDGEQAVRGAILGQDVAITRTFDILKRTVMGLSGAQAADTVRPRGVLFFAGPTGVGKTELAKRITKIVFGAEEAYLRFDMSEFAQEHTEARLIGSPPGYVGHGAGGELTRAIREQPFRLVLFDEIEKAHSRILDKFLQILDDGRLTDGQGETVHFTETLIVFTSNLGVVGADEQGRPVRLVEPDEDYEVVEERIRTSIEDYITNQLGRPELLTRIGDNIVVFDFIRPDIAPRIFDLMAANVAERVADVHGMQLVLAEPARHAIMQWCTADLAKGARGIGAALEGMLVNPLARAMFERGVTPGAGATITVSEARRTRAGVELDVV